MNAKRVALGFDLRVNPELQEKEMHADQLLMRSVRSPISADPGVWLSTEEMKSVEDLNLSDFLNPFYLWKNANSLLGFCQRKEISTAASWLVCLTINAANLIALKKQYGTGYFENQPDEESLLSEGWRLLGVDVIGLEGLISGLKGCGYTEPTWSQLRSYFAVFLNEVGLFADFPVASEFAEVRGLQIRDHAPFVTVGILSRAIP